jgi:DNA-binding NarL/FixJ family response regulator
VPDQRSAAELLEELQQAQPGTPVVIHAPQCRPTEIVGLVRLGAFHVLEHGDATVFFTWRPILSRAPNTP